MRDLLFSDTKSLSRKVNAYRMKKLILLLTIPFLMGLISAPPRDDKLSIQTQQYLGDIYSNLNKLDFVDLDPNGSRIGHYGDMVIYNNSGVYTVKVCTSEPSGTTWADSVPAYTPEVPLTTVNGGTGATANANAASGVVVLNASSQLPAVSGALLTNLPVYTPTQVNDVETIGVTFDENQEFTLLSVAKTITSGNTVLLTASGYITNNASTGPTVTTIKLKQGATVVQTLVMTFAVVSEKKIWSVCGIVTGLSGAITFSVTAQSDTNDNNTGYGNLVVLEF